MIVKNFIRIIGLLILAQPLQAAVDFKVKAEVAKMMKSATEAFVTATDNLGTNASSVLNALMVLNTSLVPNAKVVRDKKLQDYSKELIKELKKSYPVFTQTLLGKASGKRQGMLSSVAYLNAANLQTAVKYLQSIRNCLNVFSSSDTLFMKPFEDFLVTFRGSVKDEAIVKYLKDMTQVIEDASFGNSASSVISGLKDLNNNANRVVARAEKGNITALSSEPRSLDMKEYTAYDMAFSALMKKLDEGTSAVKVSGPAGLLVAVLKPDDIKKVRAELMKLSSILHAFMPKLGFVEDEAWYDGFKVRVENFRTSDRARALEIKINVQLNDAIASLGSLNPFSGVRSEKALLKKLESLVEDLSNVVTNKKNADIKKEAVPAHLIVLATFISMVRKLEKECKTTESGKGSIDVSETGLPIVQAELLKVFNVIKLAYKKIYEIDQSAKFKAEADNAKRAVVNFDKAEQQSHGSVQQSRDEAAALAAGEDITVAPSRRRVKVRTETAKENRTGGSKESLPPLPIPQSVSVIHSVD